MQPIKALPMTYTVLAIITLLFGLASRASWIDKTSFIYLYTGDILWALLVFWLCCLFFKKSESRRICLYAAVFCFGIELSQLYHAEWIDALRQHSLGGLILGYVFKISDLLCYSCGLIIGFSIDRFVLRGVIR